ncbi:MAG: NAD(P)/FAD-dependent oxidoreductase [cyanobacterium endosymbiont of Rhopalodia musculus]|uniref:NAD(P)/FAD-dependent oxidoreductase n=1 Tax=cyanobacterium endosymbiont of Epithemia clementina EcSB TaxID=3034674 RepID=UPI002480C13D|nr:FAD-dependent oxidoreductase [cyanobacterium endosymbiont of Epithemia clementina EcSB]WGT67012.1 FAD-dependent oxidoreductase [cyanobacterium endosymbiont of Epithemia clementina EcSB]
MIHVAVIGAGVIGAAIAYELSLVKGLRITLIDKQVPASGSTGAALGVLMGVLSRKTKGRSWKLRQTSLERYETLIPELEILTKQSIPVNRQGILMLRFAEESIGEWEKLITIRQSQGYDLKIWDQETLNRKCPHIDNHRIVGAIYSPQDLQINPQKLTQALVKGASINGVNCKFGIEVKNIISNTLKDSNVRQCYKIQTTEGNIKIDELVIAAGLGSTPLTITSSQPLDIRPVLGQALQIKLNKLPGNKDFQPVITGNDVHIVPLGNREYWIGATVEFPDEMGEIISRPELLEKVKRKAISFCPTLQDAKVIKTWFGKRPRPQGEPAPIIRKLPHYSNILLATGHYRNGVLLAPATALAIREYWFG